MRGLLELRQTNRQKARQTTNRWTQGHYQEHYLPALLNYAVDNKWVFRILEVLIIN